MNIVWLKRDLRLQDHEPLNQCELSKDEYQIIYIFEPSVIKYPDTSLRHLQFIYHSILEMNEKLKPFNREILIMQGECLDVFKDLINQSPVKNIYSYQESGIPLTYKRDLKLKEYFKNNNIRWNEYQRDGIERGINNRRGWDKRWFSTMNKEIIDNKYSKSKNSTLSNKFELDKNLLKKLNNYPKYYKKPGEIEAHKTLKSFTSKRGFNYSKFISKPTESRISCGRISPHLAWGNISVKQAYQFVKNHPNYIRNKRSFNGLLTRLKWRCHFIQKFEVECEIEKLCVNRAFETLERSNNKEFIKAWKEGKTGLPLVDANMRCLIKTGWINFRMRAMLVSIFCHHMDCDWREGVYHLANLFLDYEPGIHFSQFQMQAGTTGINAIRIYNPIKQSYDHDEDGLFIKKWVPELKEYDKENIHEPWKTPPLILELMKNKSKYPEPIIDVDEASRAARQKIWSHRKLKSVKTENKRILVTHTRNN